MHYVLREERPGLPVHSDQGMWPYPVEGPCCSDSPSYRVHSRFPTGDHQAEGSEDLEPRLVQAADLIGQLGDPLYLKKANALFYEFRETGFARQLGYDCPADLVERYPEFYWHSVAPHIRQAVAYLNVTASGRQWIANLHHVFCAEHSSCLMGPTL